MENAKFKPGDRVHWIKPKIKLTSYHEVAIIESF